MNTIKQVSRNIVLLLLCIMCVIMTSCSISPTRDGGVQAALAPTPTVLEYNAQTEGMSPEKREFTEANNRYLETQVALLPNRTPNPNPIIATAKPYPTSTLLTGIYKDCLEVKAHEMVTKNCWSEVFGTTYIFLRAGASTTDERQGLILISARSVDSPLPGAGIFYQTPSRHGQVEVSGAQGWLVSLRADDGTLFAFDLFSHTWEDPTITPIPVPPGTPYPWQIWAIHTQDGTDAVFVQLYFHARPPRNGKHAELAMVPSDWITTAAMVDDYPFTWEAPQDIGTITIHAISNVKIGNDTVSGIVSLSTSTGLSGTLNMATGEWHFAR